MPIGKRTLNDLPCRPTKFPTGRKKSGSKIADENGDKNPVMNDGLLVGGFCLLPSRSHKTKVFENIISYRILEQSSRG